MNKTTEDSLIILEQRYESACISRDYALHKIEELQEENLMLADENKKMAEYLLYLDKGMVIELERDGFGWLL